MTINELREMLQYNDMEIYYKDQVYNIIPLNIFMPCSAGKSGEDFKQYDTFDDLLNNFMIDDKPLKDMLEVIEW